MTRCARRSTSISTTRGACPTKAVSTRPPPPKARAWEGGSKPHRVSRARRAPLLASSAAAVTADRGFARPPPRCQPADGLRRLTLTRVLACRAAPRAVRRRYGDYGDGRPKRRDPKQRDLERGSTRLSTNCSTLSQLSTKPLEANAQVWDMGILPYLQIFLTIGILELMTEVRIAPFPSSFFLFPNGKHASSFRHRSRRFAGSVCPGRVACRPTPVPFRRAGFALPRLLGSRLARGGPAMIFVFSSGRSGSRFARAGGRSAGRPGGGDARACVLAGPRRTRGRSQARRRPSRRFVITCVIACCPNAQATVKPHYMSSEGDGWINIFGVSNSKGGAELASLKAKEIKNGRLAMIGIASFYCSAVIPGSVPGLAGMNM